LLKPKAIPANRYDLLCMEGFARALRVFLGKEAAPVRAIFFFSPFLSGPSFLSCF
jgi:hypothetical protein